MSGLHVNVDAMNKNGSEILDCVQEFSNELKVLNDNVEELKKVWTGSTADEFYKSFVSQINNLDQFRKLLYNLGSGVIEGAAILGNSDDVGTRV